MAEKPSLPSRFYSLDVLRGLSALAIVFTHWYVFFGVESGHSDFVTEKQPFYGVLQPFYTQGWRAVDVFFCLSGFVFFWLYAPRIAERRIGAGEFSVLRLSRLYPLHFATLLFVAAAQGVMRWRFGAFFGVPLNDGYHFILNLFFISGLGFERGGSFNGPVWSVSVEIFLYAVFYLVCMFGLRRWWQVGLMAALGLILEFTHYAAVGRGMFGFFIGGLCFILFSALRNRGITIKPSILAGATSLLWLLVSLNLRYNLIYHAFGRIFGYNRLILGKDVGVILTHFALQCLPFQILPIPCTIISLALIETSRGTLGKRVAFLGDISYSTYLLHFPLQLVFAFVVFSLGRKDTVFYSPAMLVLFFVVLILLSLMSYHYFEHPAQLYLRHRLLPKASERATFAAPGVVLPAAGTGFQATAATSREPPVQPDDAGVR